MTESQQLTRLTEQVAELQSQMAFQEDTIAALNSEVTLLQREVEALNLRWRDTREQIETLQNEPASGQTEPPPPHY